MGHNQPSEVDNDQLRAIVELDTLVTRWEAAEELNVHHSSYLKQTGKVKKFDKWVPHEVKVKVIQPCPISCHPIDYTVHGILQARILEWLAVPFSRGSLQPRDQTPVSHIAGRFFTSRATWKPKNTGVGSLSLLQWIFLTQKLKWGLLYCRWIFYQLIYRETHFIYSVYFLVFFVHILLEDHWASWVCKWWLPLNLGNFQQLFL